MTKRSAYSTLARLGETWPRRRRHLRSMAACRPSELHRIAQDVGLSETDLWFLSSSHSGPRELMPRRLEQLGLDPAYIKVARTATYRDLQTVCAACKAWPRCARDLANGDVQAGMRSYCLNAMTIVALTVDRLPELTRIELLDEGRTWR